MTDRQFDVMARLIFEQAIKEARCGELLSCLFEGGSATVQAGVGLVLLGAEGVAQLGGHRASVVCGAEEPETAMDQYPNTCVLSGGHNEHQSASGARWKDDEE